MALLTIYSCKENGDKDDNNNIVLQVNPTEIKIDLQNKFSDQRGMGTIGSEQKFMRAEPGSFLFKTLLDSTGSIDDAPADVLETIKKIYALCYEYVGDKHEPNKVIVIWGDFYFKGNLKKLGVSYKLFSPAGKLLRAELDFTFEEFVSSKEEAKKKNQSSPDITHVYTVLAGTTIPSLCNKIYKNSSLFQIIAKVNNLTDFRNVKPGTELIFPPLK